MEVVTDTKNGYKKTKVGWIPEDWLYEKLGNCIEIPNGQVNPTDNEYKNLPHIGPGNIEKQTGRLLEFNLAHEDNIISGKYLFDETYLLYSKIRPELAKVAFPKFKGLASADIYPIRGKNGILNTDYLLFLLLTNHFYYYSVSVSNRTGMPKINRPDLYAFKCTLPSLSEQQKIAQILSTWDKAIVQSQNLIEQLKNRKKGLMQQLLTGKTRLKGFNGEWKEYSYSDLLKEVRRPVKWDDEELYHLISVRRRSGGLFEREKLFGRDILTKNLKTTKAGDFLISKMQIVHGASGLTTTEFDEMKISGSYISMRARDEKILNIEFFSWLSKMSYFYYQTYVASYGVHIEKMTFDFKTFLKLKTCIPSIDEQTAITKILNTSDVEIKTQETYLQQLQDQKKGLMQQLLTGQKRVKI